MPKKTIAGIMVGGTLAALPVVPVSTYCFNHYDKPIYDTPTGDLRDGYYLAPLPKATSTKIIEAHLVKTVPTAQCVDNKKNKYEISISKNERVNEVRNKIVNKSAVDMIVDLVE